MEGEAGVHREKRAGGLEISRPLAFAKSGRDSSGDGASAGLGEISKRGKPAPFHRAGNHAGETGGGSGEAAGYAGGARGGKSGDEDNKAGVEPGSGRIRTGDACAGNGKR